MKQLYIIVTLIFLTFSLKSQTIDTLNQTATPVGGIDELALNYFLIDFTKDQRKMLAGVELEFIYRIAETGKPTLEKVNGIDDQFILDSLKNTTSKIPNFYPALANGVPISSFYFMQLSYPKYQIKGRGLRLNEMYAYNKAKMEDFEYLKKSHRDMDMVISGMANHFIGNPAEHLGLGGGMKVDMSFSDKNNFSYGLSMNIYSNKLKKDFPVAVNREQLSTPTTIMLGAMVGKWFDKFSLQLEINYIAQNITERMNEQNPDPDWVQFKGWSPGLVVNYPIKIGKDDTTYFNGPAVVNHQINLHLGIRPVFFNEKEATGAMIELGVGYRMTTISVKDYQYTKDYLNK